MALNAVNRYTALVMCGAVSLGAVLFAGVGSASSLGIEARSSSPEICSTESGISSCLTVLAVGEPSTTGRLMSGFMENLWKSNSKGGSPIVGVYQLQSCSSNGPSPFQMHCVLWTSASRRDANLLEQRFDSSHLFQIIDISTFARLATESRTQLEVDGCLGVSTPPTPAPGASEAISMPDSTLSALSRARNAALDRAVREYEAAARTGSLDPMIRALDAVVSDCHRQGFRTAT